MEERKVNLFVVGAMKAGTTSLMDMLSQHSQIFTSPIKEPNYFVKEVPKILYEPSKFFNIDHYFEEDFPNPLHIAHIINELHYDKLFSGRNNEKYLLEGSTMYLHAPGTAKRIYEYNPFAKIVISLRDPLHRAFSHYNMLVGLSRETRSFEVVMKQDIENYKAGNLNWYSCLGMSFYQQKIQEYKHYFKDVYIIHFEDLIKDDLNILNNLFEFLEIESLDNLKDTKNNETRKIRFKWFLFLLKKAGLKDYFSAIFSSKFKHKIFRLVSSSKKPSIELSSEIVNELIEIFKKES